MLVNILVICVSFLCCLSCQRHDAWRTVSIKTGNAEFDAAKLLYPSTNLCHDLEVEILYASHSLFAYINIYCEEVPPYEGNPQVALLNLETKQQRYSFLVDRLAGGQRLKIPEDALPNFIKLFENNSSLVLSIPGYRTKISTQDFKKHFQTLKNKPLSFIPNDPISLAL